MTKNLNLSQNLWFTNFQQPAKNRVRLFVFPYSGAGSVIYHPWSQYFSDKSIDLIAVKLPGREQRSKEKSITYLPTLIDYLLDVIYPLTDVPFAFFGHSMGGLISFELSRALLRAKHPMPQHLFISGFRSPDMPNPNQELHKLYDNQLLQKIREYGGTPEAILNNKEIMGLLLPVIRADFKLFESYEYKPSKPLKCPITIFSGNEDKIVKPAYMKNWRNKTYGQVKHITYPGSHFFINNNRKLVIEEIENQLKNHQNPAS